METTITVGTKETIEDIENKIYFARRETENIRLGIDHMTKELENVRKECEGLPLGRKLPYQKMILELENRLDQAWKDFSPWNIKVNVRIER